eukprot:1308871-Pyramimonas_sp.AAC.1
MAATAWTASLALLLFNPLSAKPDRQQEIIEEAVNFDVIILAGTQRWRRELHPEQRQIQGARVYDAGWRTGTLTNRSTGMMIAIQGKLRGAQVTSVLEPPGELCGRGLALQLVQYDTQITI